VTITLHKRKNDNRAVNSTDSDVIKDDEN